MQHGVNRPTIFRMDQLAPVLEPVRRSRKRTAATKLNLSFRNSPPILVASQPRNKFRGHPKTGMAPVLEPVRRSRKRAAASKLNLCSVPRHRLLSLREKRNKFRGHPPNFNRSRSPPSRVAPVLEPVRRGRKTTAATKRNHLFSPTRRRFLSLREERNNSGATLQ